MLSKLPSGQDALISAYDAIEKTVHDVDAYVRVGYFLYWCISFLSDCFFLSVDLMVCEL